MTESEKQKQEEAIDHASDLGLKSIQLVKDAPGTEDLFHGGAHDRLAQTCVQLITDSDSGFAIGLEGKWGSGKSTVGRMVINRLVSSTTKRGFQVAPFEYDAWANQGDPTRRVFLRALIHALKDKLPNRGKWEKRYEELDARRRTVRREARARLAPVAAMMYFLVPLLPLAYVWLSPFAFGAGSADARSSQSAEGSLFGLPHTGAIAVFLVYALIPVVYGVYLRAAKGRGFLEAFSFVDRTSTDQQYHEEWVRDSEPTAEEFHSAMEEVALDLQRNDHALVLLIDNIDRLPKDHLRDFWANLRNLFSTGEGRKGESLENVWILVPFDREHVSAVFSEDEVGANQEQHANSMAQTDPGASVARSRALTGFVEKTFRIVFRVPPPLLADTAEFLDRLLRESVGDAISDVERRQIIEVADALLLRDDHGPTPRQLKTFVNEVVALAATWRGRVPIQHLAIYAGLRDELIQNMESMRRGHFPELRIRTLAEGNLPESLAALAYGVEVDHALETLLEEPIRRNVAAGNAEEIEAYSETRGFEPLLYRAIERLASVDDAAQRDLLEGVCNVLPGLDKKGVQIVPSCWRLVAGAIRDLAERKIFVLNLREVETQGVAALLEAAPKEFTIPLARAVVTRPAVWEEEKRQSEYARRLVTTYSELAPYVDKVLGDEWKTGGPTSVPLPNAKVAAYALRSILGTGNVRPRNFQYRAVARELLQEVVNAEIGDDLQQGQKSEFVRLLLEAGVDEWSPLLQRLTEICRSEDPNGPLANVKVATEWYLALRSNRPTRELVEDDIRALMQDGTLQKAFSMVWEEDSVVAGRLAWVMLVSGGDENVFAGDSQPPRGGEAAQAKAQWGQALNDFADAEWTSDDCLLTAVESGADGDAVFEIAAGRSNDEFWGDLRSRVAVDPVRYEVSVKTAVENIQFLDQIHEEGQRAIIEYLASHASRVRECVDAIGVGELELSERITRTLLETDERLGTEIGGAIAEFVGACTREDWNAALKGKGPAIMLLHAAISWGSEPTVNNDAVYAAKCAFDNVLGENSEGVIADPPVWRRLVADISDAQRASIEEYAWSQLIQSAFKASDIRTALKYLVSDKGGAQIPAMILRDKRFWNRVVVPLIEEANEDGLRFLDKHADQLSRGVTELAESDREHVEEALDSVGIEEGAAGYGAVERIRRVMGH